MEDFILNQKIIGFSLNIFPELCAKEIWTLSNRQRYLLNSKIFQPLTADEMMWPSLKEDELKEVFDVFIKQTGHSVEHLHNSINLLKYIPDSWFHYSAEIWVTIGWLMAFSVENKKAEELQHVYGKLNITGKEVEDIISDGWILVGYDIVDDGSISGLANCSYKSGEKERLSSYVPLLNQYGLFNSYVHANEFCEKTNERVPEHAPFCIQGIWAHPNNKGLISPNKNE